MEYKIVLTRDSEGWFVAECLNLPGCISQGKNKKEALANITDAIKGYLASVKKHPEDFVFQAGISREKLNSLL